MKTLVAGLSALLLAALLSLACGTVSAEEGGATFSQAELDQMMAPIALYPDSLLSQILMASTYPADVAEAVTWSKNNPDQTGDAAAEAVQNKPWDPSVMSLAAFPQVLAMMGEQPDWVQQVGDAFLAMPETVMDTVQQLRKRAKDEGNLESSEQQTVIVEQESTGPSVIIIEPASPQIVYVPSYNPTVIYGTWWWPAYRPYYYHPVGWGFGAGVAVGIRWGIGIGVTRALWGGCNWGRRSVNINVNRYNSINVNKNRLSSSNRNSSWKHNSNNRRGVPYRDQNSRQKYSNKLGGADQRKNYRGRDADRSKARSSMEKRGMDPAKQRDNLKGSGGREARDSVKKANRDVAKTRDAAKTRDMGKTRDAAKTRDMGKTRDTAKTRDVGKTREAAKSRDMGKTRDTAKTRDVGRTRDAAKSRDASRKYSGTRDNALKGAGNTQRSNRNSSRGSSSNRSMQSRGGGGHRSGGGGRRR